MDPWAGSRTAGALQHGNAGRLYFGILASVVGSSSSTPPQGDREGGRERERSVGENSFSKSKNKMRL